MSEDTRNKKLVKNTAVLSIGTICTKGLMFIMTPLFTHWLSKEGYGTFDLLLTYVSLLMPLFTLECNEAMFRFLLDTKEVKEKKRIISTASLIDFIGLIVSLLVITGIAIIRAEIRQVLFFFYILLAAETFYNITTRIIRGIKKLPVYALASLLFVIVMAGSSFVLIQVFNLGLQGIILGYTIGYGVCTAVMIVMAKTYPYFSLFSIDRKLLKEMLRYSIPLLPAEISWWIVNVSDRTIISIFLGTANNAIYAVANKFPNLCQTMFGVFHLSWQENAVETVNDRDRDVYYSYIFNGIITLLSTICILIVSLNFFMFETLFPREYFLGYYITPILVASVLFSMLSQFLGSIYLAQFDSKKSGTTAAIGAIVNILVHLVLIKRLSLYAAAISTAVSYCSLFFIRYQDVTKKVRLIVCVKTKVCLVALVYFSLASYLYIRWLNLVNIGAAVTVFFLINRDIAASFMKKWNRRYRYVKKNNKKTYIGEKI